MFSAENSYLMTVHVFLIDQMAKAVVKVSQALSRSKTILVTRHGCLQRAYGIFTKRTRRFQAAPERSVVFSFKIPEINQETEQNQKLRPLKGTIKFHSSTHFPGFLKLYHA